MNVEGAKVTGDSYVKGRRDAGTILGVRKDQGLVKIESKQREV